MGEHREGPIARLAPEDREYLTMMYQEHAEHARQHETLRAAVTGLMMALIAGLLAFAVEQLNVWLAGLGVCAASLLGMLLNHLHQARFEQHNDTLTKFRLALGKGVRQDFGDIRQPYQKGFFRLHLDDDIPSYVIIWDSNDSQFGATAANLRDGQARNL